MKRLIQCYCIVSLLVLSPSCKNNQGNNQGIPTLPKQEITRQYQSINEVPPQYMKAYFEAGYRLQPDKRFLLAIKEIHRFFNRNYSLGHPANDDVVVETTYHEGKQHIFLDKKHIAALPEFPGFQDFFHVLLAETKKLQQQFHTNPASNNQRLATDNKNLAKINEHIHKFFPYELLAALELIDQEWKQGDHSIMLLKKGAAALSLLAFQTLDLLEISDLVYARALAFLAIARSLEGPELLKEEGILAYAMGYKSHAIEVTARCPTGNLFYLFITRDDENLKTIAEDTSKDNPMARYLWLLRFAENREKEEWLNSLSKLFAGERFPLSIAKAVFDLKTFSFDGSFSNDLPYMTAHRMALHLGDNTLAININNLLSQTKEGFATTGTLAKLIQVFESNTAKLGGKGPLLDKDCEAAFFRAYFYSGLYKQGIFFLDSLASVPAAEDFLKEIGEHPYPVTRGFKQLFSALVSPYLKKTPVTSLIQMLESVDMIRGEALTRYFKEISDRLFFSSPLMPSAARTLIARLDTRITHCQYLRWLFINKLYDLKRGEKIFQGIVSRDPARQYTFEHKLYYEYNQEPEKLKELLQLPGLSLIYHLDIINDLAKWRILTGTELRKEFDDFISRHPHYWYGYDLYASYLKKIDNYQDAGNILEKYIKTHDSSTGFDYINTLKELARIYYHQGRYREGLKIIEPAAESWQAGSMETKAALMAKLGQKVPAVELSKEVIERYPTVLRSRVSLAEIYWENGDYDPATAILKEYPFEFKTFDWGKEIAPRFYQVFKDKPPQAAASAFNSLAATKINPYYLQFIPFEYASAGDMETAFAMITSLKASFDIKLYLNVTAYGYLENWRGKQEALKWIAKKISKGMTGYAILAIYSFGKYDLLWDLLDNPLEKDREALWLMRAAGVLKSGGEKNPHWPKLREYFRDEGEGATYYHTIGRFLTGYVSEEEITAEMTTPKKKCEIAYYLGLKKEYQGELYEASDWYRVCVDTGLENNGEYGWAFHTLNAWVRQQAFLKNLDLKKVAKDNELPEMIR